MSDHILKPSNLKLFLQYVENQKYRFKCFSNDECYRKFFFEDTESGQLVTGKIIPTPSEGERTHWGKLQHRNLNRLLDVVNVKESINIFISPVVGKSIRNFIHEDSFRQHPLCFDRKKNYVRDILLGLDYMHYNSMYHLNLNNSNVEISSCDRAIICDFSYTTSKKTIPKRLFPAHIPFKPPEVLTANAECTVYCLPLDMWASGILFLQIFTQNFLPWPGMMSYSLDSLDNEILQSGNIGSNLYSNAITDFKEFLKKLLSHIPKLRISTEEAYKSDFLQNSQSPYSEQARNFWQQSQVSDHCRPMDDEHFANIEDVLSSNKLDSETNVSKSHSQDCVDYCENTSANIDKVLPIKTISEPGSTIHFDTSVCCARPYTSFPSLLKRNSTQSEIFFGTFCSSRCKKVKSVTSRCLNLPDNNRCVKSKEQIPHNSQHNSPYDTFLTEWDADVLATDESTVYSPLDQSIKKDTKIYSSHEKNIQKCHESLYSCFPIEYNQKFIGEVFDGSTDENSEIYYCNEIRGEMNNSIDLSCCEPPSSNFANFPQHTISNSSLFSNMKPDDIIFSDTSETENFENVQCEICRKNIVHYSKRKLDGSFEASPLVGNVSSDNSKMGKESTECHSSLNEILDGSNNYPRNSNTIRGRKYLDNARKRKSAVNITNSGNADSSCLRNTEHLMYDLAHTSFIQSHSDLESSSRKRKKRKRWYHRLCIGCRKKN